MSSNIRQRPQPSTTAKDSQRKDDKPPKAKKSQPSTPQQDPKVYRNALLITVILIISAIFLYLFYPNSQRLFSTDNSRPLANGRKFSNKEKDKEFEERLSSYNCSELLLHARSMVTRGVDWYDSALDLLAACAIQEPNNSGVRWNMAVVLLKMGRYDEARIWMEEAVELDPKEASYRKGLSEFYMYRNMYKSAGPHLEAYLQNKGGVVDWPLLLNELYMIRDDEKSFLLEMFDKDDLKQIVDQMIVCYIETGDFRKADQSYDILSSLWPDDQLLHLHYSTFSFGIGIPLRGAVELQRFMILEFIKQERGSLHEAYNVVGEQSLLLLTSGINSHIISMVRALLRSPDSASEIMNDACELVEKDFNSLRDNNLYLTVIRRVLERCLARQNLVKPFVNKGALLYINNQFGWTPLLQACSLDSNNFLDQLVAAGADRNARNALGQTCLHIATMYGSFNLVKYLSRTDFNFSSGDLFQKTAGDLACQQRWAAEKFFNALGLKIPRGCLIEPAFVASKPTRLGGWLEGPQAIPDDLKSDSCGIDVLETISPERFLIDYLSIQKPVLIRNILKDRNKLKLSFQRQNLEKKFGSLTFQSKAVNYGVVMTSLDNTTELILSDFMVKMTNIFTENNQLLIEEIFPSDSIYQNIPDDSALLEDFKLPEILSPDKQNIHLRNYKFYIGPALSGVPPHFHSHSWDVLLYGQRRLFLFPPNKAFFSKQHVLDWYRDDVLNSIEDKGYLGCTQDSGDLLYIPDMWGQAVLNIKESIGFSQEFEHGLSEFSI
ncbi:hypothetical protein LOD99_4527 [Oopsacas minuta]|uniref:JmjC domain-containing protein n=1 Tax=Oopsacas minuta TaxID=111878 RepID=A0AAV7JT54_9METZ|nr:hypothetical protein LOD99_4527 [Oopsacas minuta]